MDKNTILNVIRKLASVQGKYGRLLRGIENAEEEEREAYLTMLERLNFGDEIDLILYLES